jgi:hypothetical protein
MVAIVNGTNRLSLGSIAASDGYPGIWIGIAAGSETYGNQCIAISGGILALSGTTSGIRFAVAGATGAELLTGSFALVSSYVLGWSSGQPPTASDTGISRLAAGSLAIGNGTAGDTTGNLSLNTIIKYDGVTTVKAGVPSLVASTALTGQSAAISASTIYAVPAGKAGLYRITYSATITTAGTTSVLGGQNGMQSVYTSIADGQVKTSIPTTPVISAANTTATEISGVVCAYAQASTNIQYNFGYTSTGTAMVYALEAYVEYLG